MKRWERKIEIDEISCLLKGC